MVAVAPGDRVVLRTDDGYVALRVLRAAELVGPWQVHVLALVGRAPSATGTLELARDGGGVVSLPARLGVVDGALVLQAGHAPTPPGAPRSHDGEQRRGGARGGPRLPPRGRARLGRGRAARGRGGGGAPPAGPGRRARRARRGGVPRADGRRAHPRRLRERCAAGPAGPGCHAGRRLPALP